MAKKKSSKKLWSEKATKESNALDLEAKIFTKSPKEIALSLKKSAEKVIVRSFAEILFVLVNFDSPSTKNICFTS